MIQSTNVQFIFVNENIEAIINLKMMVVRFNYDPSLNYSVDHGISMRYHEMEHDYQHFNIKFEPAKYHTADTIFPVNSKDRNTVLIPPLYAYKT